MSPLFTIGQVSKQIGVSCHTLRFWEKELPGILVPLRTNGGQRRYAPEHIDIIQEIKALRDKGVGLPEIRSRMGGYKGAQGREADIIERVAKEIAQIVRMALSSFITNNSG